ncbi:hypothetical protein EGW08_001892, partial [Elysia chlorotica]
LRSGWTFSLALVLAVPATLTAEHWNQAESDRSAWSMCRVDRPPSVSILSLIILPSFCQLILGVGKPDARQVKVTDWPSPTVKFCIRSINRGGSIFSPTSSHLVIVIVVHLDTIAVPRELGCRTSHYQTVHPDRVPLTDLYISRHALKLRLGHCLVYPSAFFW